MFRWLRRRRPTYDYEVTVTVTIDSAPIHLHRNADLGDVPDKYRDKLLCDCEQAIESYTKARVLTLVWTPKNGAKVILA